ncbi:MAG TPA: hypothetical protein VHR45_18550 [Thermoanaerobaculia bacterium]|nr:hypothetical protein [Thermoanaerobaculia bacterium]
MPEKVTTIQVGRATLAQLERWGARAHRGGGDFARNTVLLRSLQALYAFVEFSDPRETAGLPEAMFRVVVEAVEAPWRLRPLEVKQLAEVLRRSPGFEEAAREAGIETRELLAKIEPLGFAEKLALVYRAIQEQAPRAAAVVPAEF